MFNLNWPTHVPRIYLWECPINLRVFRRVCQRTSFTRKWNEILRLTSNHTTSEAYIGYPSSSNQYGFLSWISLEPKLSFELAILRIEQGFSKADHKPSWDFIVSNLELTELLNRLNSKNQVEILHWLILNW